MVKGKWVITKELPNLGKVWYSGIGSWTRRNEFIEKYRSRNTVLKIYDAMRTCDLNRDVKIEEWNGLDRE